MNERGWRRGWAALVLAAAGGLAGLGPFLLATAQPAWAATYSIEMDVKDGQPGKFEFDPNFKQININDRIIWTNKTSQRHTVTSDPGAGAFDSGEIASGGVFEWKFKTAGTYTYRCQIHSEMVGRIEVTDPNAPTTTTPPPTTATTATTAPPTTTTTAPPTTTTTESPTTSTTASRPPAGVIPVPTSAGAPPPPAPPSTSSSVPSTTTTTAAPPTTPSSAAPTLAGEQPAPPAPAPESSTTSAAPAPKPDEAGGNLPEAAGPISSRDGKLDLATVALVSLLVLVGGFGAWTLIRVRPGRI